jgi:hypothetical protein
VSSFAKFNDALRPQEMQGFLESCVPERDSCVFVVVTPLVEFHVTGVTEGGDRPIVSLDS